MNALPGSRLAAAFEVAVEALRTDRVRTRSAIVALGIAMAIVVCLATLVERGRAATISALEKAGLSNLYLVNKPSTPAPDVPITRLTAAEVSKIASLLPVRAFAVARMVREEVGFTSTSLSSPIYAVSGDLSGVLGVRARAGRLLGDL